MSKLQIVSKPISVCGVTYVDVQTPHGIASKLQAEVTLFNKLIALGVNPDNAKKLIDGEIARYAMQLLAESKID